MPGPVHSLSKEGEHHVLCVHEDKDFFELIEEQLNLAEENYLLYEAISKNETVNKIEDEVMSCLLSVCDSKECLENLSEIRKEKPLIPIILVLDENLEIAKEEIPAGISGYMIKREIKDRPEMLMQRIRDCIKQKSALNEREKVLDRVTDAFFAIGSDWEFNYANDKAKQLLEREDEPLVGKNIWEEFPEAKGSTFQEKYEEALSSQEPVRFQEYYPPLETWFRVHVFPSESGLSVYFRDITKSKSRIDRLEDQKKRLEIIDDINSTVQDISREIIDKNTRKGIFEEVCDRLEASEAYSSAWIEESEGDISENKKDRTQENSTVSQNFETEDISDNESIEGSSKAAIPMLYEDKFLGSINLLTYREDAFGGGEKDVLSGLANGIAQVVNSKERKKKYESLIENIPNGTVFLFDENLTYTLVGGENFNKYTVDPEDAQGQKVTDLDVLPDDLRDKLEEAYKAAFESERTVFESKFQGRNLHIHVTPVKDVEGNIFRGMHLTQDITQRKNLEEDQEERLKRFSEIISHDLRNPLNVAQGYLDLAEKSKDEEDFKKVEEALRSIEGVVESLALITKDQEDIEKKEISLKDVFEEARTLSGVEVKYEVEDTKLEASKRELIRLMSNLISNAEEHNSEDTVMKAGPLENGFYVEDDGEGIEDKKKVFQYGYSDSDGQGLGLPIVKRITDLNGWDLELKESEDGGARFEFSF